MWPLLSRDGQAVQYIALLLLWNRFIGHNPFRIQKAELFDLFTLVRPILFQLACWLNNT